MNVPRWLPVAAALSLVAASSPALANGRFPAAGQIAFDPSSADRILVRATYGVLLSDDGGARWYWVCEGGVGFSGEQDPMMGITGDGTILAGLVEGLSITKDHGCQWDIAPGGLKDHYVADLAVGRKDPASALALVSSNNGTGKILSQVWRSSDNAKTWTKTPVDLPDTLSGLTVDGAPSDPQRIYASGAYGAPDYAGALLRSKDGGKTWTSLPIPGSQDLHTPYIGAIDPKNADIVYVRLDGAMSDELVVSKDGGDTWTQVLSATSLVGFALSPDGSTIAAGSKPDGLWMAPTSTLSFTKVSTLSVGCLTWTAQGLYACADEEADGFSVGRSTDGGKTFSAVMRRNELCGPRKCAVESSTDMACTPLWSNLQTTLGGTTCPEVGGSASSGTASASGSSSSSGSGGGSGSTGGGSGGCSCSAGGGESGGLLASLAAVSALALLGRRRRAEP